MPDYFIFRTTKILTVNGYILYINTFLRLLALQICIKIDLPIRF